jgi:hypothetical protein
MPRSKHAHLNRIRYELPYGLWWCEDGREFLFNRAYQPIWRRGPGRAAEPVDRSARIPYDTRHYLYDDRRHPALDANVLRQVEATLTDFLAGRDLTIRILFD